MKAYIICVVLIAIAFTSGCETTQLLSTSDVELRDMKNSRFKLKHECYVFEPLDAHYKYPLVGFRSLAPGVGGGGIFPEHPRDWIGKRYDSIRILGILPQGTVFTVVQLRRVTAPIIGVMTRFDISIEGDASKTWPILDGLWLTNAKAPPVTFYPQIVEALNTHGTP